MDTYFVWNDEKASQISKTSINTVVNSLKDLAIRSRVDGLGILLFAFDDNVVKSEEMTKEFFKVSISKISFIKHIRHMINPKLNSFCA